MIARLFKFMPSLFKRPKKCVYLPKKALMFEFKKICLPGMYEKAMPQ